tara:strand:- start:752 stop:1624 length:873 start_codon:yes stop_codon:yes gene_type:complete
MYNKYIKTQNIPAFKRYMSTRGTVPFHTFKECMFTKGGKHRSIFTKSTKFKKVHNEVQAYGMYLAPANMVKGINTCRGSGACTDGCLAYSGNLSSVQSQNKQYLFTVGLYHHTELFLLEIVQQLFRLAHRYAFDGVDLAIRLNSTSDLPFHNVIDMKALWYDISNLDHFYDYTKIPTRYKVQSQHTKTRGMSSTVFYHLTYSYSELSKDKWLSRFDRVAVVVSYEDKKKLLKDTRFTDGDSHDLRKFDESKIVLLGVKRVGGFQGMNKERSVAESFIQSYDKVISLLEVV